MVVLTAKINKNKMKNQSVKEIVSEFLGFLKYKVDNDAMTLEDVKALAQAIMGGLPVRGTVKDFAGFYGKPEDSIRHVIHRRVFEKPKRRVEYTFRNIDKEVPTSWHDCNDPVD